MLRVGSEHSLTAYFDGTEPSPQSLYLQKTVFP